MAQDFIIEDNKLKQYTGSDYNNVIIPEGVSEISEHAFFMKQSISKLVLPKSLKKINNSAFITDYPNGHPQWNKQYIKELVINGSPKILRWAFGSIGVKDIKVGDSAKYSSADGVLFNKDKTKLVLFPSKKDIAEYRVPESVTTIEPYAFYKANVLIVYIPKNLLKFEFFGGAFSSIGLPDNAFTRYERYVSWSYNEDIKDKSGWLPNCIVFYSLNQFEKTGCDSKLWSILPIYLGGPIDDIPGEYKRYAAKGFLHAMQIGIDEILPYKAGYFDYIKKNEDKFLDPGNDYGFNLMLQEKLVSEKAVKKLVEHPYVKKTPELMAKVLDYKESFGEHSLSALSLNEDDVEMKRRIRMEERRKEIRGQKGIKGIVFVATGEMDNFGWQDEYTGAKDWSDLQEYIEARGGFLRSAVSSKTDYIICNDPSLQTSKMKKARELGISVISEEEFMNMAKGDED